MTAAITWTNLREALEEVDAWVDAYPAETVLALWEAKAWKMLDYASWEALCESRGWTKRIALPRPERREVVATLRQEGMSTRAIAAATGVSNATVSRDLEATVTDVTVESVTSLDGRTRPATQPSRPTVTVQPSHEPVLVVPEVVDSEPVEVLTSDEWHEARALRVPAGDGMTIHHYPEGITSMGSPCWCQSLFLSGHVSSMEIDGTIHARGWCESLRAVPSPGLVSPGASPANPPSGS